MTRPLRTELPGAPYHLTERGNARGAIFLDDLDRRGCLSILGDVVERYPWICHASTEAHELLTPVINYRGPSASARRTAAIIGCNYKKVDKIRKIRRDGTPEIQEAVRNDRIGINKAYKLIRDMELGEDEKTSRRKLTAAQIKVVKSMLSEENFTGLEALSDDLGSLLNQAVEQFISAHSDMPHDEARDDGT